MYFNSNQQRLKHSESVFEALLHLGGKATFSELVTQIAESVRRPESAVESDVKQVLRAAVLNGYLVRHGKNYLISRSCRTMCTDSVNRNSSTSKTQEEEDVKERNFTTFGFPLWWNRFWNRFVVSKERNQMRSDQNTDGCLVTESVQESDSDTHENTIAKKSSSDSINKPEEIAPIQEAEENQCTDGLKEEEAFSSVSTDSKPLTAKYNKEVKESDSNDSIEDGDGNDSDFFWLNDEFKNDCWMD